MRRPRPLFALLATLVVVLGCATEQGPTAPAVPAATEEQRILAPLLDGLLTCYPQPYARATAVIGPAGGTLHVGRHTLVVPRGALAGPVRITGEAPVGVVASVSFEPHGLQFARTAALTLDYSSCPMGRLRLLKRVAYTDDDLNILSYLLSRDDLLRMRVTGDLDHFSRYAVAW
ncbi:MAG: hypothetical protein SF070_19060 [Gemmatimonadota bacterium]|nr:hypothetical protein [Gemmatimonadota bacterium]